MKQLLLVTVFVLFAAGLYAKEGYYVKLVNRIPQIDGTQEQKIISEQYITDDVIKTVTSDQIILITKKGMKIFDRKNKVCIEKTISQLSSAMLMYDGSISGFEIKPTGEKVVVGKWSTEKYAASMTMMDMRTVYYIYITKEIDYPGDILYRSQSLLCPSCENTKKMMEAYRKIGGFQVKVEMNMMGATGDTEVIEVKKMNFTDEEMEEPKGYKVVDLENKDDDAQPKNE